MEQATLWEVQDQPPLAPTPPQQRDEVWDKLEQILGYQPRTDTEKTAFGKAVRSLKRAGATVEEMDSAAKSYQKAWPQCELTLWSFEKWFSHFLSKGHRNGPKRPPCAECGVGGGMHVDGCSRATHAEGDLPVDLLPSTWSGTNGQGSMPGMPA